MTSYVQLQIGSVCVRLITDVTLVPYPVVHVQVLLQRRTLPEHPRAEFTLVVPQIEVDVHVLLQPELLGERFATDVTDLGWLYMGFHVQLEREALPKAFLAVITVEFLSHVSLYMFDDKKTCEKHCPTLVTDVVFVLTDIPFWFVFTFDELLYMDSQFWSGFDLYSCFLFYFNRVTIFDHVCCLVIRFNIVFQFGNIIFFFVERKRCWIHGALLYFRLGIQCCYQLFIR
jgi:hypothetical protein